MAFVCFSYSPRITCTLLGEMLAPRGSSCRTRLSERLEGLQIGDEEGDMPNQNEPLVVGVSKPYTTSVIHDSRPSLVQCLSLSIVKCL